ncbi:MAG: ATP-binding cassette domain-containing protein [Gammaproteobacteria bacterium]|jgi:ABC-2 type transport system ATP-binding protein|nr:ATP-binding cassette domain-containing protein [Gammaproteobacteria bacterium]
MIEVRELSRSYGALKAVDAVSFDIGRREIVGLLGHNGAGKTTILKMLTGFLEPSGGSIRIDGTDITARRREVQRRIGYLPENCPLYPDVTVLEHLDYQGALHGIPARQRPAAIRRAVERTELGPKATATVATLSRGYRQRVGVASALLHEPDVLILDEPTNGLDPSQIQHMRALIREQAGHATVIISTHILQEVEAVCGRVLIMRAGRLALDSAIGAIGATPRLRVTLDRRPGDVREALGAVPGITAVDHIGDEGARRDFALTTEDPTAAAPQVAAAIAERGWPLYALARERHGLEAVFGQIAEADVPAATPPLARAAGAQGTEAAHG